MQFLARLAGVVLLPVAVHASVAAAAPPVRRGAVTDHVILVSIDGLRPDAIEKYQANTLRRLVREGAFSAHAHTILPSKTLPSHTSMLTGVLPSVHGVTWNTDETASKGTVKVPTIFELAKDVGFTTAAFFSKPKFHHLEKPGTLDYTQAPNGLDTWLATKTVPDAVSYLRSHRPNLLFVHIGEPDYAGHSIGWMSFAYGWAVRRADAGVAQLIKAADATYGKDGYTLLVTSDHGGHGREHGTADERDTSIPWLAWGEGVRGDLALPGGIRTMDTAATVLWLLGIPVPSSWTGAPVTAAFTPTARIVAAAAIASTH